MSLGTAKLADSDDVWGKHRVSIWDVTGDAAYVNGTGYVVTAAQFGLRRIYGMKRLGGNTAGNTFLIEYDTVNSAIRWYNPTNTTPAVGPATEATNNQASVNNSTARMLIIGE